MKIRVAIVEDDRRVRECLTMLVGGSPGFELAGTFADAESACQDLPKIEPHVVLMDIQLPKQSGIECIQLLRPILPKTQFIVLTVYDDEARVFEALRVGAVGYLEKNTPPVEILDAIQDAHRGGSPMSSAIARRVVAHFQAGPRKAPSGPEPQSAHFSPREEEIIQLLLQGYRYKEVAERLSCSIHTVREHLRRVYEKLQVSTCRDALVKYLQSSSTPGTAR